MRNSHKLLRGAIAVCLFAAMLLTGCNGKNTSRSSVKLDNGELQEDSVVMAVGEEGVRYSEVLTYCYLLKRQYEGNFSSKLWKYSLGEGKTIGDQAKQEIVNMITQLKVIKETAEEQKISLNNDERDEALQKAETLMETVSEEDKKQYCLSVQGLSDIYQENILANKMFYVATDKADTNISDEEAKQRKIQFVEVITNGVDSGGKQIAMDEATKKQAESRARDLRKQALQIKDFLVFAQRNSDNGVQELTIGRDTEQLEKAAVDAAFALEEKEISNVIEGEEGYYIIYCAMDQDEEATDARKEEIIQERQTEMFKEKYASWLKKCEVKISEEFWDVFEM